MSQVITAIFENGMLRPEQPLDLPSGARVRVCLEPIEPQAELDKAWEEWDKLCDETRLSAGASRLTRDQLHERR
jgi:predicted DNA-binding antitoxin AbrB/MazE fold protein